MPTAIRISTPISESTNTAKKSGQSQLVSIALFSGIGLVVSLVAVLFGIQGAWF